jgi:hypothetical protein
MPAVVIDELNIVTAPTAFNRYNQFNWSPSLKLSGKPFAQRAGVHN